MFVIGSYSLLGRIKSFIKGQKLPDNEFYTKQQFGPITRPRSADNQYRIPFPFAEVTFLINFKPRIPKLVV